MIAEIATDPQVIDSLDRFERFTGDFGIDKGRLIACFPKRWEEMVKNHLKQRRDSHKVGTIEMQTIVERMAQGRFQWKLWRDKRGADFTEIAQWLDEALNEHERERFNLIIAQKPREHPDITTPEKVTSEDPRFRLATSKIVNARASDICAAINPILQMSREIVLVDPYFRPDEERYMKVLRCILQGLRYERLRRIEYHLGDKDLDRGTFKTARAEITTWGLSSHLIKLLTFVVWRSDQMFEAGKFHDRFVLTESGGVSIGAGLCEGTNREEKRNLQILDRDMHQRWWDSFRKQPRSAGNCLRSEI